MFNVERKNIVIKPSVGYHLRFLEKVFMYAQRRFRIKHKLLKKTILLKIRFFNFLLKWLYVNKRNYIIEKEENPHSDEKILSSPKKLQCVYAHI